MMSFALRASYPPVHRCPEEDQVPADVNAPLPGAEAGAAFLNLGIFLHDHGVAGLDGGRTAAGYMQQVAIRSYLDLCRSPRSQDSVTFGRPTPQSCAAYHQFGERYAQVKLETGYAARKNFFDFCNREVMPFLTTEESAMQLLAQRIAYLRLPVSSAQEPYLLSLNVSKTLLGKEVDFYASSYYVRDEISSAFGLTAVFLLPAGAAASQESSASIILFRGTYNAAHRDLLARHHASGWVTNGDSAGPGTQAFAESEQQLKSWVTATIARKKPVVLVGHSLGGAQASLTLASLNSEEQKYCRLITFAPPGFSAATVNRLVGCSSQMRSVWHAGDPVARLFGEAFPLLKFGCEISNRVIAQDVPALIEGTHSKLFLVESDLCGKSLQARSITKTTPFPIGNLEGARKSVGQLAARHLPEIFLPF